MINRLECPDRRVCRCCSKAGKREQAGHEKASHKKAMSDPAVQGFGKSLDKFHGNSSPDTKQGQSIIPPGGCRLAEKTDLQRKATKEEPVRPVSISTLRKDTFWQG